MVRRLTSRCFSEGGDEDPHYSVNSISRVGNNAIFALLCKLPPWTRLSTFDICGPTLLTSSDGISRVSYQAGGRWGDGQSDSSGVTVLRAFTVMEGIERWFLDAVLSST